MPLLTEHLLDRESQIVVVFDVKNLHLGRLDIPEYTSPHLKP